MLNKNSKLRAVLTWLDDNIMLLSAAFLIAFIPLWPKIPVWSPIEQYIVRVRLEDFFLLLADVIWLIQVLRKKIAWRSTMFWFVLAYEIVSAISVLTAFFITQTVPLQLLHMEKTLLHFFRYIEYFSFFFIVYAAIKKRRDIVLLLIIFAVTVVGISVYGWGQKYYYWPVYSTMNREFSKGERLVLTPHARVQSTFGGHYDMAAFLVVALPILLALAYQTENKVFKYSLFASFIAGTWLIIMSASRTSFVAFVATMLLLITILSLQRHTIKERIRFAASRGFMLLFLCGVLYGVFGGDLNDRLSQVLDSNQQLHDTFHNLNKERKDLWQNIFGQRSGLIAQLSTPATPPPGAITTDQAIQMGVLNPTDEEPATPPSPIPTPIATTVASSAAHPADVYVNVPDIQKVATVSASGAAEIIEVNKGPRVYSENAFKYGLSMAIRLDTLWPRAIQGFLSDPLFGKGYATLNKESKYQFTEAESTDNNFLRTLGETGLLGFITFYGCCVLVLVYCWRGFKSTDGLERALSVGLFGATLGLLINAIYIDVFASSKVAEMYWGMCGLFLGYVTLVRKENILPVVQTAEVPMIISSEKNRLPIKDRKQSKKKKRNHAST